MFPILPTFELDFRFPMLLLKPHFELLKCNKFKCLVECERSFNKGKPDMSHEILKSIFINPSRWSQKMEND
jgi:hypothetical protein